MNVAFMTQTYLKQSSIGFYVRPWISASSILRLPSSTAHMSKRMPIRKKFVKKIVRKETRAYQEQLDQQEINADREANGKKP